MMIDAPIGLEAGLSALALFRGLRGPERHALGLPLAHRMSMSVTWPEAGWCRSHWLANWLGAGSGSTPDLSGQSERLI